MSRYPIQSVLATTAALAILPISAFAQVYKCPGPDGRPAYQGTPCAGGKAVDVRPASGSSATYSPAAAVAANTTGKEKALLDQYERERRVRSVNYDIDQIERTIAADQQHLDAELDALRNKKRYANNNLAGAQWESSISEEMQAVTERYKNKAAADRATLDDLRKQRAALMQ